MSHWLLDNIIETKNEALKQAQKLQVYRDFLNKPVDWDTSLIKQTAEDLEFIAIDCYMDSNNEGKKDLLKTCAADAFRLYRVLPRPENSLEDGIMRLRMCCLAVLGDMGVDAARLLRETYWPDLPIKSEKWGERTWSCIIDVWLRLIRKLGWKDRDAVLEEIATLRSAQQDFEHQYLNEQEPLEAKSAALELISLYHLAKAAEIFAHYITDGVVKGNHQIHQLLEMHFDRVFTVCKHAQMLELEPLSRLLAACSYQMAENSIWTVTRAVNTRVTNFVRTLVDRGRGDKAIFDVLPPQRRTLAEEGLLGSSRRAVVVSLPTSSGKTLIAEFRILQALNQFEHEEGWVAYIAPTKALVNQVARQLRRDFEPLNIVVEQVSPALEVDNIEMNLLQEQNESQKFRVLVTTPEKLDLLLRQGWEGKIGRPLTLVIVDEAHNIQNVRRGLKLELLLATINNECRNAQFLLLTPFIENAREVAHWLGGPSSDDISLSLDWQPNDRMIGIVQAEKSEALGRNSFNYKLSLETVHTNKNTLVVDDLLSFDKTSEIAATFSQVNSLSKIAAVTAQRLKERGPVIVMHARPGWVWSLAEKLKIEQNKFASLSDKVKLVQDFLALEFGESFPLIDLLSHGIGIHHAGLPDDVRALMEWLFEEEELNFLVATTSIAQGVNFPVTGVVMASHQYPEENRMIDMLPEDFWNITGRAGRIGQGSLGIVALAAESEEKAQTLKGFINKQTGELNSALIELAKEAQGMLNDLGDIVYRKPEWSNFLQYLAHTYKQMGQPDSFFEQVEQVLRGTLGFGKLRTADFSLANSLLEGVRVYTNYLQEPGQPLGLVDSTGFSLQSINTVFTHKGDINSSSWDTDILFRRENQILQDMMGVLLRVPELRDNLKAVTGGDLPDGQKLALIVKDWVNGNSIMDIALQHFKGPKDKDIDALTRCGQNLFGKLTQTASWGLSALLSITASDVSEEQFQSLSNIPSKVYYGVNQDSAIALRLLGIPRAAATPLSNAMGDSLHQPLPRIREHLQELPENTWEQTLGEHSGKVYRKIWRVLEGLD